MPLPRPLRATGGSTTAAATTGATGTAQATRTSGTSLGKATIRAQVMDFSTALTLDFISGIPAQVVLRAIPSTVGVGTTTTVQATVTTATGVPVEGATVTFALAVNNSSASLQSTSGMTNASGLANITYTAGSRIGTDTVRATVSGNLVSTVAIDVQATTVTATSLELLVSSPQLDSDGVEQVTLTALVRDANNNFVTGAPVTFAADSGGIQVTAGNTDASGKATALLGNSRRPDQPHH
jgi:Bacterial Ig-like domain (group 1)